MFESPVKQSLSQSPKGTRRPAAGYSVYNVLLVLTRGSDVSRSANAVSAIYRKFSTPSSHLAPSFGVTLFEFMEKFYGSWNSSLPGSRRWRSGDPSLHRFDWSTHVTDGQTDGQTELRWLRRATAVPAVARKSSTCCCA